MIGHFWRNIGFYLTAFFGVAGLLFVTAFILTLNLPAGVFTRDVFAVVRAFPYVGILSNLTAFLWVASLTVILLTWSICRTENNPRKSTFLISSAVISAILLIDDFFMFHDRILVLSIGPQFLSLFGFQVEKLFFALLGAIIVIYLIVYRQPLLRLSPHYLAIALVMMGLSLGVDLVQSISQPIIGHWHYLLEDGPKWIGACFWFAHFASIGKKLLRSKALP